MRHLRSTLLAVLAVAAPGLATAADMPWGRGPTVISERPSHEEEIGTGWYLRGDIGVAKAISPSFDMAGTIFSDTARDASFVFGGGFGYKFNDWLRADLTIDRVATLGLKHNIGSVTCNTTDTCTIDSHFGGTVMPVLANAYLDLGNWHGIGPYVGGGVGAALMQTGGDFIYTDTTTAGTVTTHTKSGSVWSPAFAAMAGFTVDLGSGIQLDAGYRYLWLTQGATGTLTQTGNGGVVPATVEFKHNADHQARVGLRYYVN